MNYVDKYAQFLSTFAKLEAETKVVFDASNGTAGIVLEELLPKIPQLEGHIINGTPDGDFPAHGPNPLGENAFEDLRKAISREGADLGVIFDGDADRVLFLDEQGTSIDSYEAFLLIKGYFDPPFVVDVRALADFTMPGVPVVESMAGRLFIWEAMRKHEADLGVERTGHYFFKKYRYFDSAIIASLCLINFVSELKAQGKTLSQAVGDLPKVNYPPEINFQVADTQACIDEVRSEFESEATDIRQLDGLSVYTNHFAFNIRASATEPLLRLNIAAKDEETLEETLGRLKPLLK